MHKLNGIASFACGLALAGAAGSAGALDIVLPPETAAYRPSELPGYPLALRDCLTCHSAHYVQSQPPASPRAYWEATVRKMQKTFGAPFADEDIPALVDYLAKTYGDERAALTATPDRAQEAKSRDALERAKKVLLRRSVLSHF